MIRSILCSVMFLGLAGAASADELDREFAPKAAATPTAVAATPAGSELDQESPAQACHWRGGWGYGSYYGYGYSPIGFGYSSFGYSPISYSSGFYPGYYGGFGYSPFYGSRFNVGFYGGLGGFGYSSFYGYRGFGPRWGWYW